MSSSLTTAAAEPTPPPEQRPPRRRVVPFRSTSQGTYTSDSGDSQDGLPNLKYCIYGVDDDDDFDNDGYDDPKNYNDNNDDNDNENSTKDRLPFACAPHHVVPLKLLRKLASRGIPDEDDRGVVWRLLLGYLPEATDDWMGRVQEARSFYQSCVQDLFADTYDCTTGRDALRWRPRSALRAPPPPHGRDEEDREEEDNNQEKEEDEILDCDKSHNKDNDNSNEPEEEKLPPSPPPPCSLERPPPVTPELPEAIKQAWKARGKDEHLLHNLNQSYNALHLGKFCGGNKPSDTEDGTNNDDDNSWDRAAKQYVESAVLLDEVRKDVVRTHPDLSFFLEPSYDLGKRRYAALERILFVWATYNKGVRYVQGMNEIVGAIYYVLAKDGKAFWTANAEADTYYLFATLLAEMRDVFISDMDDADTGIQGRLAHMQQLLLLHDPQVKEHLDEVGVDVSYYAVRWWTTLLSREFLLPDTIRLWDSMFASTHKDNFMRYVCVTMVLVIRDRLLKGDFSSCIKLLQGYPPAHMDHLIDASRALWIYETQITLAMNKGGFTRHMALQAIKPPSAIIMAFGFQGGVAPKTRAEILEEAGGKAADRVRDATTKVATSARSYFGKANGIINRYMNRTVSSDSAGGGNDPNATADPNTGTEEIRFNEEKLRAFEDDRYMSEFL